MVITLQIVGKKLICTDDDIFAHPAHSFKQQKKTKQQERSISTSLIQPLYIQNFGNSDLYYYKNHKQGRVLLINRGLELCSEQ